MTADDPGRWATRPATEHDRECVRLVAALLGSSRAAVCGKSRHPVDTRARRAVMVALKARGLSQPVTGRELGGKDPSTVCEALARSPILDAVDITFQHAVAEGVAVGASISPPRTPADTSNPREAIIGLLSTGRLNSASVLALWHVAAAMAGIPAAPPAVTC